MCVLYSAGVVCTGLLGFCVLALGRSNSYWDLLGLVGVALIWPLLAVFLGGVTLLEEVGILEKY